MRLEKRQSVDGGTRGRTGRRALTYVCSVASNDLLQQLGSGWRISACIGVDSDSLPKTILSDHASLKGEQTDPPQQGSTGLCPGFAHQRRPSEFLDDFNVEARNGQPARRGSSGTRAVGMLFMFAQLKAAFRIQQHQFAYNVIYQLGRNVARLGDIHVRRCH